MTMRPAIDTRIFKLTPAPPPRPSPPGQGGAQPQGEGACDNHPRHGGGASLPAAES